MKLMGALAAVVTLLATGQPAARAAAAPAVGFRVLYRVLSARHDGLVRRIWLPYTAWNGDRRWALVELPAWYGARLHPPVPLVISPHGRGGTARGNAAYWGALPAFGPFALVCPQGQGRRLVAYSWGWRGQIDDLARMPRILRRALPWLRISRVYAVGSSMGGQETLLLDALHPRVLAGAVALDSATNMAARYRAFASLRDGAGLQQLAQAEIGGTPATAPDAYAARSPLSYASRLARNGVPLYIWWSTRDRVVRNQWAESGLLYRRIKRIDPLAPVYQYVGSWAHSAEMHPMTQLPLALVELGLVHVDQPLARKLARRADALARRAADVSLTIPVQVPNGFGASRPARTGRLADLSGPGTFSASLPWLGPRTR